MSQLPIPLVGTQQQPTFPQVGLNIMPQGLMVTIQLGPTTSINQIIDANVMDQVAKEWRESRKNVDAIFRAVQQSKNN
jgi:hypothetical protein